MIRGAVFNEFLKQRAPSILIFDISTPERYYQSLHVLEQFPTKGIYVTTRRPAAHLQDACKRLGIETRHLTFIDTISRRIMSHSRAEKCVYTTPYLSDILATIEHTARSLLGEKFLIIDRLHDLFLNYDEATLLTFLDTLSKRLKILRIKGVFLTDIQRLTEPIHDKLREISTHIF